MHARDQNTMREEGYSSPGVACGKKGKKERAKGMQKKRYHRGIGDVIAHRRGKT